MTSCKFVSTTEPRVVSGRHLSPCACDDRGLGCLPCPEIHCVVCGKEHAKAACTGCLDAARSDLKAIGDLCASLPAEAVEKGVQSEAMMLLGPVADPGEWNRATTAAIFSQVHMEVQGVPTPLSAVAYLSDCRDEFHPTWVLGTWEQVWRDHLDHQTEERVTTEGAVAYLDLQIGYMADQIDPPFDEFARELRGCRAHLENVLQDGIREERGQVPCVDCETRLIKVFAEKEPDDHWLCPKCRRTYTDQEYARAQHFHMEDERGDRWVRCSEAVAAVDRPEQTLRTWMRNGDVKVDRDAKTGALMVWWPDVRQMNLKTPRRNRGNTPTYSGLHQMIRRTRGSASEFPCVDCGGQAQHWSYNHTASVEYQSALGSPYTTDPNHYSPRCTTCHARFDSASA